MQTHVSQAERRATFVLVIAVVLAAAIAACSDVASPTETGVLARGVYVQAEWESARQVNGHRAHVLTEKIACTKCHAMTERSIGAVSPERCADCHAEEAKLSHAPEQAQKRFGTKVTSDCTSCHAFKLPEGHAHLDGGATTIDATDCGRCHLSQQGDTPAVQVHETERCVTCHKPHEHEKPTSAPCADCHEDVQTTHAAHGKSITAVCTTCHQHQHAPASDARPTCVECHAKEQPIVPASALFEGGHLECVGCHRPHEFDEGKAVACRSCHETQTVLGGRGIAAHNQCTSCHSAHDVRRSPEQACARCHGGVHPDHPKVAGASTCVGCHDPHPSGGQLHGNAKACTTCHQVAASETDFHQGVACRRCHAPHDFVVSLGDSGRCRDCHAGPVTKAATNAGHQACQSCHRGLPHRPAALEVGCDSCHAKVHADANPGHRACTKCHEPHAGTVAVGCASCHKAEHASAPAGHQTCNKCHDGHSGATTASCSSCHAGQARARHGSLPGGCNSCHRAHGPEGVAAPPRCTSCHQPTTLPALHAEPRHQDCARCHSGHSDPKSAARSACLGCHTERRNHFPDAPRCANCHLFGKSR